MTLEELRAQFWTDADDLIEPGRLFSPEQVTAWLNEAEEEAALRANLLHESELEAICQIPVVAGTTVYAFDDRLFNITYMDFTATGSDETTEQTITDRIEEDRLDRTWRSRTEASNRIIVEDTRLRFTWIPVAGLLRLEGYRAPLEKMAEPDDTPEINRAHHTHLVQWALHRAFSIPDSETIDPTRADKAEKAFTRQFGIRPDADLRRSSEANRPLFNKAVW